MPASPYPLTTKPGVILDPRTRELDYLLAGLQAACDALGYPFMVTCGREAHSPTDPHTLGRAIDIRTANLTPGLICVLYGFLQGVYGPDWYVQYEWPSGQETLDATDPRMTFAVLNPQATASHLHAQRRIGRGPLPAPLVV